MEPRSSLSRLLALSAILATLLGAAVVAGKGRKIVIHVPYYVKNHHHTHTVFKYMKGKDGGGGGEGDTESVSGVGVVGGDGGGNGDEDGGGASLEQAPLVHHHGEAGGEGADDGGFGGGGYSSGEQQDFFHSSQGEDAGHQDEGATQDAPQALALHGEPRPPHQDHGGDGDHRGHHGRGGDGYNRSQHSHGGDGYNRSHHSQSGDGDKRGQHRGHGHGLLHHRQRIQQQQRVREEDSHLHREEKTRHQHKKHRHHYGNDDDGREHAHFHTKFVVGENDGPVHEDSSESSELSSHGTHGVLAPHREPVRSLIPREHDYHNRYEVTDHESFEKRPISETTHHGDNFNDEERHHGHHPHREGYNVLPTELRPDESQHYSSAGFAKEHTSTFDRYRNEKFDDKFVPRENKGFRKYKGKRFEEPPRRQKYEVEEPNQDSSPSRDTFSTFQNPDYEPIRRRKQNFDWR